VAGNTAVKAVTFTVSVSYDSLCRLAASYSTSALVDAALCATLAAAKALAPRAPLLARLTLALFKAGVLVARAARVLNATQASTLTRLADSL
jgi:hypothetical protein